MGVGSRKGGKGKKNSFLKLYTKFLGGKIFTATRVVSSKNSQLAPRKLTCITKNSEMWVVHTKNVGVLYVYRLASKKFA